MEEILQHLKETYVITKDDLNLPDDDRNFLLGQLSMIDEIEDLYVNGIPNKESDDD